MVCPVADTEGKELFQTDLAFLRRVAFFMGTFLTGYPEDLPFASVPDARSLSSLAMNTEGSSSSCLRSFPCSERINFSCISTAGVFADLPLKRGSSRIEVMGLPSGRV